jgi:phenylacetate-CoA ligase
MNPIFYQLYAKLPPSLRDIPATLRGYYLRSWRYGSDTPQIVAEALEREHWTSAQWKEWQSERLARQLHRAATRVPYYREQWRQRRLNGDNASWEVLANWPILEKRTVREVGPALVADDCDRSKMFVDRTSGTTGTPLSIWQRRGAIRNWYGLFEARTRLWYGVSRSSRWAILGGQTVTPLSQQKPPFWVWNHALHQLYLSTFHLKAEYIPDYVKALRRHRIEYLVGYSAALHVLARHLLTMGVRLPMKVVVTNAEPLFPQQREAIEEAFCCPVHATYGMAEAVVAASECEHNTLHLWPDAGVVEVLSNGVPVRPGVSGDLVCTGLLNPDMPLIRYAVGDRGRLPADAEPCPCGRTLPRLESIEGRTNDSLLARDGRRVFWLNPVFYGLPVAEAQIVQESLDLVRVIYVAADGFNDQAAQTIVSRTRKLVGPVDVQLEPVTQVPREPSGKFRAVLCRVPDPSPTVFHR